MSALEVIKGSKNTETKTKNSAVSLTFISAFQKWRISRFVMKPFCFEDIQMTRARGFAELRAAGFFSGSE